MTDSDSDMPDGADMPDSAPSAGRYLRIATLIVWTLALFVLGVAGLEDGAPTATLLVSALVLSALVVVGAAADLRIAALVVWTLILWGVVLAFAPEEEWDNSILAFTLALSMLVVFGAAALIRPRLDDRGHVAHRRGGRPLALLAQAYAPRGTRRCRLPQLLGREPRVARGVARDPAHS